MNVLGVGAHYDDLELGCSGTLIKHVENGDKVTMVVVTDSSYRSPDGKLVRTAAAAYKEGQKAAKIIGAKLICLKYKTFMVPFDERLTSKILDYIEKLKIDIVYSHWTGDLHRDHQYAAKSTLMAGRHVPRFLMYRSNFYTTEQLFKGTFYSDISGVMTKKKKVIEAHKSELARVKYHWLDFFTKQHQNDGKIIGAKHAECFETVRYLV
ncbi:MAG: PIG-L family deacetylase [Candidatus Omnitrophica bacterium]|nr:PIG-L family deacetylase [Candidatus Omnitrophota bacterium]